MKKPNNYWTKEKCHLIALKYKHRNELRKNDSSVYRISLVNKWLDEICSHMKNKLTYWNYDKCKEESLKYHTRSEFQRKNHGAYDYAVRNNILEDICSHMQKIGNKEFRCVYVFEFKNNIGYVGLTYNIKQREIDHNRKGPVYKHIKNIGCDYKLIQITDYIKKEEAQKIEEYTIIDYKNKGWKLLNTKKESTLGGNTIYWTKEKCKKEALKYKYRNDFRKNSRGSYESSRKNKWLDEICSHMKKSHSKN